MKTTYITNTGKVTLDENNVPMPFDSSRNGIDYVYMVNEDQKIVYKRGNANVELEAKAGDIIVAFYENQFPNRAIVISSKEWAENIKAYEEYDQKRKEEWAAKKCDVCECPEC